MNLPKWIKELKGEARQSALMAYADYIDIIDNAKDAEQASITKAKHDYEMDMKKANMLLLNARQIALSKLKKAKDTAAQ